MAAEALQPVWTGIAGAISAPRLPLPLRLLERLGVRHTDLVVLRASSAHLRLVGARRRRRAGLRDRRPSSLGRFEQQVFYALVAPLLPAVLVAAAYDASDPARELLAATPFSKLRIALLRTALAVVVALPVVVLMGVIVPELAGQQGGWLLPSLALTVVALALLTWFTAPVTVGVLATCWVAVVAAWATGCLPRHGHHSRRPARLRGPGAARRHDPHVATHRLSPHHRPGASVMNDFARPIASLREVSKNYGSTRALHPLDLDLYPGVIGLLGPNGAGKSHAAPPARDLAAPVDRARSPWAATT